MIMGSFGRHMGDSAHDLIMDQKRARGYGT
jgi:hypothetical protein